MFSARMLSFVRGGWLLAAGLVLTAGSLSGCGSGDPFSYVPTTGKVTYEDGTPIPAPVVHLTFVAENPPTIDEKTFAPKGKADVTSTDGSFDVVTSHNYNDGLLPGKHKVLAIATDDKHQIIEGVIPPEYKEVNKTPLEIDTANQPLVIKIKKPAGGVHPVTPGARRPQ